MRQLEDKVEPLEDKVGPLEDKVGPLKNCWKYNNKVL